MAFLQAESASLKSLINAENIQLSTEAYNQANGAAPSQLCALGTIRLPLAGLIDVAAEVAKLEKQRGELVKWIKSTEGRLANEKFVNSAPPQVVADSRSKLAELQEKLARTDELLASLK